MQKTPKIKKAKIDYQLKTLILQKRFANPPPQIEEPKAQQDFQITLLQSVLE